MRLGVQARKMARASSVPTNRVDGQCRVAIEGSRESGRPVGSVFAPFPQQRVPNSNQSIEVNASAVVYLNLNLYDHISGIGEGLWHGVCEWGLLQD
mgnify:CR=1 FL=1